MKRKEFLGRLIGEVTNFLLEGNPLRLVVSLHQEDDGAHISFFDDRPRSEEEIQRIYNSLNPQKSRPELAEYYGLMAGHDMAWDARLKLIGWQIKHASVDNSDSGLRIDLWLGSDAFNPENFTLNKKEKKK
ncbi:MULTISPECIES: hypothetical protein [Sphaerochaeta]|jgi:hypothetical protein|uniref:Uncharacterized protein n=2 Tax=root TaxID=1 RepID=A0ABY4D9P5_9SPIR|nr:MULTISPECIES: hypothetical protein [Sphaerochaeta]MDT3360360.1 hypothetical protein [Spirochaetota bacterium]NLA98170.1 hypothetical protein [Spirochaetales bacterium]MDD3424234.1 hypothetical protein [Sphaerochaeta sp.]MDD3456899.1 hypothetical protein [Sphaerochaeta sp.]MDD4037609.1 hypothetical protein [Sphaerochaeta sp.]